MKNTSSIKKVIGVMSGKGGVGKSTVSYLTANALALQGNRVGVLDADITGPSIPRLFQLKRGEIRAEGEKLLPFFTPSGIKVVSMNLLLEDEHKPVIWRGPLLSKAVDQFWNDVVWEELDVLVVDMPPGTADVALSVMQNIPLDGLLVVTTPQDMVGMIVNKSIEMAKMLNIPILGKIENMSGQVCPHCGETFSFYNTPAAGEEPMLKIPMTREIALIPESGLPLSDERTRAIVAELGEKVTAALAAREN